MIGWAEMCEGYFKGEDRILKIVTVYAAHYSGGQNSRNYNRRAWTTWI